MTDFFTNGPDWTPTPLVLLILAAILTGWIMSTPFGLQLRAIGGDESATRSSGVPVRTAKFLAYVQATQAVGRREDISAGR